MGRAAPRFSPTDAAQNYRPATFGGSEVCGKRILEGDGPREGRPQPCATRQARREGSGFAARSRSHAAAGRAVHRGAAVGRPRRSGREATLTDRWLPDRPLPTAHALAQNLGVIIRFMSTDYGGAGGVLSLPVGCSPGGLRAGPPFRVPLSPMPDEPPNKTTPGFTRHVKDEVLIHRLIKRHWTVLNTGDARGRSRALRRQSGDDARGGPSGAGTGVPPA